MTSGTESEVELDGVSRLWLVEVGKVEIGFEEREGLSISIEDLEVEITRLIDSVVEEDKTELVGAEPVTLEPIEEIALEETVPLEPTITEERKLKKMRSLWDLM